MKASIKEGWKLGEPPVCRCGKTMRPLAVSDSLANEIYTNWVCGCAAGNVPITEWPFQEDFVDLKDFHEIGFCTTSVA